VGNSQTSEKTGLERAARKPEGLSTETRPASFAEAPELRLLMGTAHLAAVALVVGSGVAVIVGGIRTAISVAAGACLAWAAISISGVGAAMFGRISNAAAALYYPVGFVAKLIVIGGVVGALANSGKVSVPLVATAFGLAYTAILVSQSVFYVKRIH
jgi:hypothetical protein